MWRQKSSPHARGIVLLSSLQGGRQKHRQVRCRGEREPASTRVTQAQVHEVEAAWVGVVPCRARGLAVPPRSKTRLSPLKGGRKNAVRVRAPLCLRVDDCVDDIDVDPVADLDSVCGRHERFDGLAAREFDFYELVVAVEFAVDHAAGAII